MFIQVQCTFLKHYTEVNLKEFFFKLRKRYSIMHEIHRYGSGELHSSADLTIAKYTIREIFHKIVGLINLRFTVPPIVSAKTVKCNIYWNSLTAANLTLL
jgi:hypothetical protein